MIEEHLFITIHFNKYPSISTPLIFLKTCLAWEFIFWGKKSHLITTYSFDMKTTLKSIRDRVTGLSNVKWTVSQASQLNMVDPGNCFLAEMLVFTAESKADFSFFFFNNPWEATDGGNQKVGSGEEGWRIFCSTGTRIHPLWWAAVHPGFNTCTVLSCLPFASLRTSAPTGRTGVNQ